MSKYKYVLNYPDGTTYDSLEEYGDDDFEGTFSDYNVAKEAALYTISCERLGNEILHMSNPGDYDYNEEDYDDIEFEVIQID